MKKIFFPAAFFFLLISCTKINVFEKNVAIKNHSWQSNVKPEIIFNIEDTASLYNLYIVLRHSDAYGYNNIWIRCTAVTPGDSTKNSRDYNLPLANNENGWTGSGMDDIFEHRVLIQPNTKFSRTGNYKFVLEQIMREDPLEHVFNVGMRVQKTK